MKLPNQAIDISSTDLQYIWNASQTVLVLDATGLYIDLESRYSLVEACLHNCKVVEIAANWSNQQNDRVNTIPPKGLYIISSAAYFAIMQSIQIAEEGRLDNSLGKEEVAILIPKLKELAEKLKEGDMMYIEPYNVSELN
jgi:hypothetical protein